MDSRKSTDVSSLFAYIYNQQFVYFLRNEWMAGIGGASEIDRAIWMYHEWRRRKNHEWDHVWLLFLFLSYHVETINWSILVFVAVCPCPFSLGRYILWQPFTYILISISELLGPCEPRSDVAWKAGSIYACVLDNGKQCFGVWLTLGIIQGPILISDLCDTLILHLQRDTAIVLQEINPLEKIVNQYNDCSQQVDFSQNRSVEQSIFRLHFHSFSVERSQPYNYIQSII